VWEIVLFYPSALSILQQDEEEHKKWEEEEAKRKPEEGESEDFDEDEV